MHWKLALRVFQCVTDQFVFGGANESILLYYYFVILFQCDSPTISLMPPHYYHHRYHYYLCQDHHYNYHHYCYHYNYHYYYYYYSFSKEIFFLVPSSVIVRFLPETLQTFALSRRCLPHIFQTLGQRLRTKRPSLKQK